MAVELEVKLNKPIEIGQLLDFSSRVLRELLGEIEFPPLFWSENDDKFPGDLRSTIFEIDYFQVHFLNSNECAAQVLVFNLDDSIPYIPEEEAGYWAVISVTSREPEDYLLIVAIAIALAEFNDTFIMDELNFWLRNRKTHWQQAKQECSRELNSQTFEKAVEEFCFSLPGKQEGQHS